MCLSKIRNWATQVSQCPYRYQYRDEGICHTTCLRPFPSDPFRSTF